MIVYRVQPEGADLHAVETETSNGNPAGGVHVFAEFGNLTATLGWLKRTGIELAEIECERRDLRDSGDYEGHTLVAGRGRIVRRRHFRDSDRVGRWAAMKIERNGYPD